MFVSLIKEQLYCSMASGVADPKNTTLRVKTPLD